MERTKVQIRCTNCGAKSRSVLPRSPAAPTLTALEELASEGWAYQIGYFAMVTGEYYPICPECAR